MPPLKSTSTSWADKDALPSVQRLCTGLQPNEAAATERGLAIVGKVTETSLHTLFFTPAIMSLLHASHLDAIPTRLVIARIVPSVSEVDGDALCGAVQARRVRPSGVEVDYLAPGRSGDPPPCLMTSVDELTAALGRDYAVLTDSSSAPSPAALLVAFDAESPRTKSFVEVGASLLVCTHPCSPLVDSFRSLSTLSLGRAMEGQEALGSSWVGGIDAHRGKDDPLPGEDQEGVDSDEWSD